MTKGHTREFRLLLVAKREDPQVQSFSTKPLIITR